MNEVFVNFLLKNLIEKKDYTLLKGDNGEIPEYNGVRLLQRLAYGSNIILEVLDGDKFSSEEIEARLARHRDVLLSIDAQNFHFFEVVVFSSSSDSEKLEVVKNGQYQKYPGKRFLACITVDLEKKDVEKHYKLPLSSGGLEKVIKDTLLEKWEDNNEPIKLEELIQKKEMEANLNFMAHKPYLSYTLIGLNIFILAAIYIYGLQSNTDFNLLLNRFGAKNNLSILSGEYWRFITPIFLHGGIMHLLVNCYSIYAVGFFVERLFGHIKFALVYFIAGIIGNIASFMFSINPGVGASGAIFGLLGALLYYGLENPTHFKRYFGHNIILMIVINISFGFTQTGIDNFAHIGGLIGGFLATGAISSKKLPLKYLNRLVFIMLTAAVILGGLYYGFNYGQNPVLQKVALMENQVAENKWVDAEKTAEEILENRRSKEAFRLEALIIAAQAETGLGKHNEAIEHGKEVLILDQKWGHYILGISYYNAKQYDKSKEELLEAKKLKAGFENIDQILNQIDEIQNQ